MDKIVVRLKDKTSTHWLAEQQVSIVGDKPVKVEKTGRVNRLIKGGVIEQVSNKYYLDYHQKKGETTDETTDEAAGEGSGSDEEAKAQFDIHLQEAENALTDEDFEYAAEEISKAKELGHSEKLDELESLLGDMQKEKFDKVVEMVDEALGKEIIREGQKGFVYKQKTVAEDKESLYHLVFKDEKIQDELAGKLSSDE